MINKGRKNDEIFTPHRRWKGKEFNRPEAQLGECVMYLPAGSAGKNKSDVRWMEGVWLGITLESGESIIGTANGVVKARDFRRKPEEGGRWSSDGTDEFNAVPWEPYPGAGGGFEIKSKVRLPADDERITINTKGKDEHAPRSVRITKKDLEKFGLQWFAQEGESGTHGGGVHGGAQEEDHGRVGEGRRREGRERERRRDSTGEWRRKRT